MLLTTVAKAEALSISPSRWVFLHGYADVAEQGFMERSDLGASPAAVMASQQALDAAGIEMTDIDTMDLYSCFPIAVSNICDGFGLSSDDPRGLTTVGGLPFFGGAGNNYSMHAIASVVRELRQKPGSYGFVGANGGFLSKYSVGVYSTTPRDFVRCDNHQLQRKVDQLPSPKVSESPEGEATIETYTVVYHKGTPAFGIVIGRLKSTDERFLALNQKSDTGVLQTMLSDDVIGRTIFVAPGTREDANRFWF